MFVGIDIDARTIWLLSDACVDPRIAVATRWTLSASA